MSAIIFLDFRKAYDTIEWSFFFHTNIHFGFQNDVFTWIQTLYRNCSLHIFNNGWKSQPIFPQRGIRQGCPISSLLFITVAEVMALIIRSINTIQGIEVKIENKISPLKISQRFL